MIVRRAIQNDSVVAGKSISSNTCLLLWKICILFVVLMNFVTGGGAIEMEISKCLRDHSRLVAGKQQALIAAAARAFEIIPRQLCDNAGLDSINMLNKLRQKHHTDSEYSFIYY